LIIKTAWGGRSLNTGFRPPSAGRYKLPKQIQDEWAKHPQGAHGIPKLEDRKKWQEDKDAASGVAAPAAMRTAFEVDNLDYDSYRIAILARQGFPVFLNGHKIHTYIWWQDKPQYRSIVLDKEQTQYLKKGKNVLAVYANDQYSPDSPEHYAALDA
jgi:hypothetical protein